MPFSFDNKSSLITCVVVIISIILFIWIVFPMLRSSQSVHPEVERFAPEAEHVMHPEEAIKQAMGNQGKLGEQEHHIEGELKPIQGQSPFVDPKTGALMDGPGFEKGDVDGMESLVSTSIPANYYYLDDGAGGEMSVQNNLCSPSCCSDSQWPTPFKQKFDPYVCNNKDQFVPSRMFCNSAFQSAGCMCLTKKQGEFLYSRGKNGRELF